MGVYKVKGRYHLYGEGGQLLLVTRSKRICEYYLGVGVVYIKRREEEV